jgi:hypothetical protein
MRSTDLVLDGGSDVTGLVRLAGAVAGLAEEYAFHRVIGTGAGAVVAALVRAGLADRLEQLLLDDKRIHRETLRLWLSAAAGVPAGPPDDRIERSALRVRLSEPLTSADLHPPTRVEAPEVLARTIYVDSPVRHADDRGVLFDDGLRAAAYFLCERATDPVRR